jgi:hypothetical protein
VSSLNRARLRRDFQACSGEPPLSVPAGTEVDIIGRQDGMILVRLLDGSATFPVEPADLEGPYVRLSQTRFACWKCGHPLWQIDPPIQGWRYHCQTCQHLTSPRHELEVALAARPEGTVGIVSAVSCRIDMG